MNEEIKSLKYLCILTYTEILHLKKLLISKGLITEKDFYDYLNSLNEYIDEFEGKNWELIKLLDERKSR